MSPPRNRPETDDLATRIATARGNETAEAEAAATNRSKAMSGMSRGFRLASEFVAAIVIGVAIGVALDAFLGTGPWLTVVFLMFGFAAGVLNVIRATRELNEAAPENLRPVPDDEDE